MPESTPTIVNVDNYVHAETARQFQRMVRSAEGLTRFSHARMPVPVTRQPIARMNRDTLYSSALVNLSEGATLTLPDSGDRYVSVAIINEDNYTTAIYHTPGSVALTIEEHESCFVAVIVRVLVDPTSDSDIQLANSIQDQVKLTANSQAPYQPISYDRESLKKTHSLLQQLGEGLTDANNTNGRKEEVDETRHLISSAYGWGGLPTYEVSYLNTFVKGPLGHYQLTLHEVPVNGFWSISIYNSEGYFEENPHDSYSTNSVLAEPNTDGSITIDFGPTYNQQKNFLYIMEGWSYVVRFYQPRAELTSGQWSMPSPEPV